MVLKRIYDLIFSILFLLCLWPIYVVSAVIIIIVSPGCPLYRAERVGRDGKLFTCYKFRSMRIDSGKVKLTTLRNDDRIFPFGKFIRKTKIDEMPQIFNILLGDMSVVGPRPEDKVIADKVYRGKYKEILEVKPGLTSPASLYDYTHGENYESEELYEKEFLPQKLDLELYYIQHQTFMYDLILTFRTSYIILQTMLGKKDFEKPRELQYIKM